MTDASNNEVDNDRILGFASEIVISYVGRNNIAAEDLPALITSVYETLKKVGSADAQGGDLTPAVPVKKSFNNDYIICLEDGKKLKMLKRYLRTRYNMTPDEYRTKWNLPADYPMVAPSYAARRSNFAKEIGLGKKKKAAQK